MSLWDRKRAKLSSTENSIPHLDRQFCIITKNHVEVYFRTTELYFLIHNRSYGKTIQSHYSLMSVQSLTCRKVFTEISIYKVIDTFLSSLPHSYKLSLYKLSLRHKSSKFVSGKNTPHDNTPPFLQAELRFVCQGHCCLFLLLLSIRPFLLLFMSSLWEEPKKTTTNGKTL